MLQIVVTAKEVGESLLYEIKGRKGRSILVPTYKVVAANDRGEHFEFAVTRDASDHFFSDEKPVRYGQNSECPPSRPMEPYHGRVRIDGKVSFSLQLFEPGCSRQETLRGQGPVDRKHIMIHFGPARSEGCLLIAGDDEGYLDFVRNLHRLLDSPEEAILVTVHERRF